MRRNSPYYGWVVENSLYYGWDSDIMWRFLCIPVQILPSAFSLHFLRIQNTEISLRSCPNTPICIFPHFLHMRMQRFLPIPVQILPSAFSPQRKCGELGYGRQHLWTLEFQVSLRYCSSQPVDVHLRSLCHNPNLLGTKPSSEPMLVYC